MADAAPRRVSAALLTPLLLLALTGCSSGNPVAQTASDASAQATTAGLALRLAAGQRSIGPATDTALQDALQRLTSDDTSLTSVDGSAKVTAERDAALRLVRRAEDAILTGRQKTGDPAAARSSAAALDAIGAALHALDQRLQG